MFAESVILRKTDTFEQAFGWRPVPHSIDDCDKMIRHFNDEENVILKSRSGNIDLRRPLTRAEKHWIDNERAMCALDCAYFLNRYYWIQTDADHGQSGIRRFSFRSGQKVFYKILKKLDEKGVSKELFCLKARKQGISTLVEGIIAWMVLFVPGTKAQVASADGQKTQIMIGMLLFAIDELPWWLEPTRTRDKRASDRAMIEYSNIGSTFMVQSGAMKGGIGQGTTPNAVHLSEVSQYTNPKVQIDEGLLKAVTSAAGNFMVLETTGDGDKWTTDMWNNCKEYYHQGKARLMPVFLPWFMTPELYPSHDWIKKYPIPKDWTACKETVEMVNKSEAYVSTSEALRIVLGRGWKMPDEQKWYWEFNFQEHRRRGMEKSWYRQMPVDDFEALLGENDKAVGDEAVNAMQKTVSNEARVYMVAGDGIETKDEPDRHFIIYGDEAQRLYSSWRDNKDNQYDWGFIPVRGIIGDPEFNPLKRAIIWEEPVPGYDYGIGVDTGTGVEMDRHVINVTRKGMDDDEPDVQVAEFADDTISNRDLYAWVAALTALYSRHMDSTLRHPKLCIEMRRKFGDMTFHQLKHAMSFHRHNWFVQLDKQTFRPQPGKTGRPGFWTNSWSRPMLLGFFTSSLENGWYSVRSRFLQQEIKDAEMKVMKSGQTRMDHTSGKHDDRVFAAAMAHWTLHDVECLAAWSKRRFNSAPDSPPEIDFSPYTVQVNVGGGALWGN